MRWSELAGKEIVNLYDGARLGRVADADLVFDPETGEVDSLVIYGKGWLAGLLGFHRQATVPWEAVRRIGPEVLIIEMSLARQPRRPAAGEPR